MVVLEKFPKLSIIGLIHEKFRRIQTFILSVLTASHLLSVRLADIAILKSVTDSEGKQPFFCAISSIVLYTKAFCSSEHLLQYYLHP
jgi:hypothetical protein